MTRPNFSSGDLIADRRADYARMLAENGDHAAAADLMRQCLELAPAWAAGWFSLGAFEEKAGNLEAAADAFRAVLRLSDGDIYGAALKLAALGQAIAPDAQPRAFVERLFDDYAERFDTALVETLRYTLPETLAGMIFAHTDRIFASAIDLGCGTGLLGERLRTRVSFLKGYDLSRGMLAKAGEKGVYDLLAQADISQSGNASGGVPLPHDGNAPADLVTAADVLMYFGDLTPVFETAAALTAPGGLFAFSVEAGAPEVPWQLQQSLRFRHGEAYLRDLCRDHGFDIIEFRPTTIRMDAGQPISGMVVLAVRQAIRDIRLPQPESIVLPPDALFRAMQTSPTLH